MTQANRGDTAQPQSGDLPVELEVDLLVNYRPPPIASCIGSIPGNNNNSSTSHGVSSKPVIGYHAGDIMKPEWLKLYSYPIRPRAKNGNRNSFSLALATWRCFSLCEGDGT